MKPLSDDALLRRLSEVMRQSRRVEADLVALIGAVDARKLYAREATSSMFAYCTEVLHLSEHEAYLRIAVARAARKHPVLLAMLRDGRLHLASIARLAPHLTEANRDEVLRRAVHRTRLGVEELVAELVPLPDAPPEIRKLPARHRPAAAPAPALPDGERAAGPAPGSSPDHLAGVRHGPDSARGGGGELGLDRVGPPSAAAVGRFRTPPPRPATVAPLAPERYKVSFTASGELREKLARLQDLMRPSVPDGDLGAIIGEAVTDKLERLEARRFAKTDAPRKTLADTNTTPTSRHVPAAVRRAVHERDGGRCTYQDARGRRCKARDRLEFHHHGQPFGRGGPHSVQNVRLMCHTHNQFLAEQEYGGEVMARHRGAASRVAGKRAVGAIGGNPGAHGGRPRPGAACRPDPSPGDADRQE